MKYSNLDRRTFLKGLSMAAAAGGLGLPGRAAAQLPPTERRFLIVLCATGGASLIDSFLAIRASESANAETLNTYPDALVQSIEGTPFRAIDSAGDAMGQLPAPWQANQSDFVRRHHQDMMVATLTGTSVNHAVAQRRAITGNEAWSGRTLQELVATTYGEGLPLPNVGMATGTAYLERGNDPTLPRHAFAETVATPALWPLSLHGLRGVDGPRAEYVEIAKRLRDQRLDPQSRFTRFFRDSPKLDLWRAQRAAQPGFEAEDLITKLMLFPDSEQTPLAAHGLAESPTGARVREAFPRFAEDPLEAQAALSYLLLRHEVSVSVTIGPSFNATLAEGASLQGGGLQEGDLVNPPIAFDFSHQAHRPTQAMMWSRLLSVADRLIGLLSATELGDGLSMWDRSMIYFATDFGRDKVRPAGAEDFGTSHHLDNGILAVSPMVRGNTVLGGVDPDTGLTFGFDPLTGAPQTGRTMTEREIFTGLVGAMGIDTSGSGLPSVPAMRRA